MVRKTWLGLMLLFSVFTASAENEALIRLNALLLQNGGTAMLIDNPANYPFYEKLEAAVRGMSRSIDNEADLVSYSNVEDGALGDMVEVEQRIRELLVQKDSGLLTPFDRDVIDSELSQLGDDLVDILKQSQFNTIKIFEPLAADPTLTQAIADPTRYTLAGVDSLLAFLGRQRTRVGARVRALEHGITGDQVAVENTRAVQEQVKLMAHLLMLK